MAWRKRKVKIVASNYYFEVNGAKNRLPDISFCNK